MNSVCLLILSNNYHFSNKEHDGRMSCWMGERAEPHCSYGAFLLFSFPAVRWVLSLMLVWNSSFSCCRSCSCIFFDPIPRSSHVLSRRECNMLLLYTTWGGIIPAELITTRPHNLRFSGLPELWERIEYSFIFFGFVKHGVLSGAVVWGTALQAGMSRVLFPMW